jgi:hypothetical protein
MIPPVWAYWLLLENGVWASHIHTHARFRAASLITHCRTTGGITGDISGGAKPGGMDSFSSFLLARCPILVLAVWIW